MSVVLCGCGDNNEPDDSYSSDYYVKYEASVSSSNYGKTVEYTVETDIGRKTFVGGKTFEQTFGPVKKGFKASVRADAGNYYGAECNVKIYVCRGNEPFALKANQSGSTNVAVSYTIDY